MSQPETSNRSGSTVQCKTTEHVEIIRRFPEIELINDDDIRQDTLDALVKLTPDYFWNIPAATTYKNHNPYCCGEKGLWIHTKMVFTAYERLVDSFEGQNFITEREADLGRAACLLHDIHKNGSNDDDGDTGALYDHDLIAAEAIEEQTTLDESVAIAIAEHMGPWYDGPMPSNKLSLLVHCADMIASDKNITVGIYQPCEELRELYPSMPAASL